MATVKIDKRTLDYLKALAKNNDREWFKKNRAWYDSSRENAEAFADEVLIRLKKSDLIDTPSGKKSLYRIYRDVRFSKDKTPYTGWFSGYFRRATKERRGGYYYRIQPGGKSVVGGGFFGPNKEDLLLLRKQIEMDDEPLRSVLESRGFKKHFGSMIGAQLKTAPKGFDKGHAAIELLRFKQFEGMRSFSDKEILSENFADEMVKTFKAIRPFFDVMSMYLTTDLNGESLLD